jgi:hypothetical protein
MIFSWFCLLFSLAGGVDCLVNLLPFSRLSTARFWKRKIKNGALTRFALGPGPSAVAINDSADISQANADAFKFVGTVKSMEEAKEPFGMGHIKTGAIVFHEKDEFVTRLVFAADLNSCRVLLACIFQGVFDQINPDLPQESRIAVNYWQ